MSDRVPIGIIPGQTSTRVSEDFPVATLGVAATVTRVFLTVTDPPLGGTVTASLRNATGGGGSGIDVTISDGARYGVATGSLSIGSSDTIYLRVTGADGDALNLQGWFEVA